jgi:hypothetical protein
MGQGAEWGRYPGLLDRDPGTESGEPRTIGLIVGLDSPDLLLNPAAIPASDQAPGAGPAQARASEQVESAASKMNSAQAGQKSPVTAAMTVVSPLQV